jgi:hypothetical protein
VAWIGAYAAGISRAGASGICAALVNTETFI